MNGDNESEVIQIEHTYTTQQVAESLAIGKSTLNKYSRSLEESGYAFFKDDSDRRAYLERDLIALRELKEVLSKNLDYNSAIKAICSKYSRDVKGLQVAPRTMPQNERYEEHYQRILEQVNEQNEKLGRLTEIILQQKELAASLQLSNPDQRREQRQYQLNMRLTERRIERKLEAEAIHDWEAKPESERMRRVGLFRKEEDRAARERFIRGFVDLHFEERMREVYEQDRG